MLLVAVLDFSIAGLVLLVVGLVLLLSWCLDSFSSFRSLASGKPALCLPEIYAMRSFQQSLVVDCDETLLGFRLQNASFKVQFSSPESGSILPVNGWSPTVRSVCFLSPLFGLPFCSRSGSLFVLLLYKKSAGFQASFWVKLGAKLLH